MTAYAITHLFCLNLFSYIVCEVYQSRSVSLKTKNTDPQKIILSSNSLWSVKPVSNFSLCQYRELCPPTALLNKIYKYDRDSRPVAPAEGYHLTCGSALHPR